MGSLKKSTFRSAAERGRIDTKTVAWLGCVVVTIVVAVYAATSLGRHQTWTPDGLLYAQQMLQDAGEPARSAQLQARRFYANQPLGHDPRYRDILSDHPRATFRELRTIFATRLLYPFVASLIYPRCGLHALIVVSLGAYVLGVIALYVFLLAFAPPWLSFFGALAFAAAPLIRGLATSALTDMLALALWIGVCAAVGWSVRRGSRWLWLLFGVLCILMTFTRPSIHLAVGAAAGLLLYAVWRHDPGLRRRAWGLGLTACAVGLLFVVVGVLRHAAGLPQTAHWAYEHWLELGKTPLPYHVWYATTIGEMLRAEASRSVRDGTIVVWLFLLVACVQRSPGGEGSARWVAPLCLGTAVANALVMLADPIPGDLARVFEAPLAPLLIAGIALFVIDLSARLRARPAVKPG